MNIQNCSFGATPIIGIPANSAKSTVVLSGINGNHSDVRVYAREFTAVTDSTVTNSSGRSWKISPNLDVASDYFPIMFKLGSVAVKSGDNHIVKCFVRRNHATQINGGIMLEEGWISGVSSHREYITVGADTWEDLIITFTPTTNGVLPIFGFCYPNGGTTHSFWFDDLSIEVM